MNSKEPGLHGGLRGGLQGNVKRKDKMEGHSQAMEFLCVCPSVSLRKASPHFLR